MNLEESDGVEHAAGASSKIGAAHVEALGEHVTRYGLVVLPGAALWSLGEALRDLGWRESTAADAYGRRGSAVTTASGLSGRRRSRTARRPS